MYRKSRFLSILKKREVEKYYEIVQKSIWYSNSKNYNSINVSEDGVNYKFKKVQILSGVFYFLSNDGSISEMQLYDYILFMSEIGGLLGIIVAVVKFIIEPIIFNFDIAKIIQIIYFKQRNKKQCQFTDVLENYDNDKSENEINS